MLLLRHTLRESSRLGYLSWIVILSPDPAPPSLDRSLHHQGRFYLSNWSHQIGADCLVSHSSRLSSSENSRGPLKLPK